MKWATDIVRPHFHGWLLAAGIFVSVACQESQALAQIPTAGPAQGSVAARRDWWFRAPGGSYGLVEVSQVNHLSNPPERKSRTSILVGPWRWTFEATAPQVITIIAVPTVVGLFTWGWIRTRRPHG